MFSLKGILVHLDSGPTEHLGRCAISSAPLTAARTLKVSRDTRRRIEFRIVCETLEM